MPTSNPKVSTYLEPEIYNLLLEWKDKNGCESISKAVSEILISQLAPASSSPLVQDQGGAARLDELEKKVVYLLEKVDHLAAPSQKKKPKPQTSNPKPQNLGIFQNALCRKFKIDSKSVAAIARRHGLSTAEYLERETGWKQVGKGWFPPGDGHL